MGSNQVYVASLESLEAFHARLSSFCQLARNTAELALIEARKLEDTLEQERRYWTSRLKRLENELALAKAELHRVRVATPRGEKPRDGDARLLIRRIRQQMEHAESAVRELGAMIATAAAAREGLRKELAELIEIVGKEPAPPVVRLRAMLERLAAYLAVQPPEAEPAEPSDESARGQGT